MTCCGGAVFRGMVCGSVVWEGYSCGVLWCGGGGLCWLYGVYYMVERSCWYMIVEIIWYMVCRVV